SVQRRVSIEQGPGQNRRLFHHASNMPRAESGQRGRRFEAERCAKISTRGLANRAASEFPIPDLAHGVCPRGTPGPLLARLRRLDPARPAPGCSVRYTSIAAS
ncbi:MAG: hypothetical protein ACM36B_13065, partial [Bacteroidota bacterium]